MRLLASWLIALPILAHDPVTTHLTYTRDISRLIDRHCIACHGGTATVPLATYQQTRPWAKAIRDQVMTRQMPPWGAVPGFGPDLQGDPTLTATEIDTVIRWVEGGAPEGDPALLPKTKRRAMPRPSTFRGPLMEVGCEWRATHDVTLLGVRSKSPVRITQTRPDGAVLPILWLRELPQRPNDFVFATPLAIPRDSVLRVRSDAAADIELALSPASAWLRLPEKAIRKQREGCPASLGTRARPANSARSESRGDPPSPETFPAQSRGADRAP